MRKGRATSIFLQGTAPTLRGLWFDSNSPFEGLRGRTWTIKEGQVTWSPGTPKDADLKVNALLEIERIHERNLQIDGEQFFRFSGTSKTGKTWSLPAVESCPIIDPTCVGCYALDGWYRTNLIGQYARVRRLEKLRDLIAANRMGEWVDWMVSKLRRLRPVEPIPEQIQGELSPWYVETFLDRTAPIAFFRWHDSGDLFNVEYTRSVVQIAQSTSNVLHWLPTRVPEMLLRVAQDGQRLPNNLAIQVSRVHDQQPDHRSVSVDKILDLQPDARIGWSEILRGPSSRTISIDNFRTVYPNGADLCPATVADRSEDRHCGGCRKCWALTSRERPIVFAFHRGN
jgi:hypothetical protein